MGASNAVASAVSLDVPAEYLEDFRTAVVNEMTELTSAMPEYREKAAQYEYCRDERRAEIAREDLAGLMSALARDAGLFGQVANASGSVTVTADAHTLAHVCEGVARLVVRSRLAERVDCSPLDTEAIPELMAELSWAVDRAAELLAEPSEALA